PVPQLPQGDLVGRHLRRLLRAEVLDALGMLAGVRHPDLTERHPALVRLLLGGRDADVIEYLLHGQLLDAHGAPWACFADVERYPMTLWGPGHAPAVGPPPAPDSCRRRRTKRVSASPTSR